MSFEITQVEVLNDEQIDRLYNWGEDIFGANEFGLVWRPKTRHFLLYDEGDLVSHVGVLKHTVLAGEAAVEVGGVGGVVTRPEAQKKGHAATLMRRVAEFFEREWRVEAGLLFCLPRMIAYYKGLGWRAVDEKVLIEQGENRIESPMGIMVLPFGGRDWPRGTVDLQSLPW